MRFGFFFQKALIGILMFMTEPLTNEGKNLQPFFCSDKTMFLNEKDEIHGVITHQFTVEQKVNLKKFKQGQPFMVDAIDLADFSQFANPAKLGFEINSLEKIREITTDPRILGYLDKLQADGKIFPLSSGELASFIAFHAGSSIYWDQEEIKSKLELMKAHGFYGGENHVSYFSLYQQASLEQGLTNYDGANSDERILFLTIDLNKLRKKRNVFIDPESLLPYYQHEFMRNFIVHHGIPVSAISSLEVLKYEGCLEHKTSNVPTI